jgi:hypothetical protein
MIERKQLFRHDPEHGVYGDCHRTALACLLDLEPEQVPHFGENFESPEVFSHRVAEWLSAQGWCEVSVPYQSTLDELLQCQEALNPDVYYLLGGKSRTGCGHTVIGCGGEIVWDPSLDNSGIVAPFDTDGLYWVTWLVPLSMRRVA